MSVKQLIPVGSNNSNFTYEIVSKHNLNSIFSNLTSNENITIDNLKTRMNNKDFMLQFKQIEKGIFANNLVLIDSFLPKIISHILLEFYLRDKKEVARILETLDNENPLNFDQNEKYNFYSYKVGKLLLAINRGMKPSQVWNGKSVINKAETNFTNSNQYEKYLLKNTILDIANANQQKMVKVFQDNGHFYVALKF
ncbi:MAG: HpaII family restriction endonuclease [Saprospiraceae bacterium]